MTETLRVLALALLAALGGCKERPTASGLADDASATAAASPTYDGILSLTQTQSLRSIDALLAALPAAYPGFLDHYVLLRKSRSPQYATASLPRVIVATPDARFLMAFNGAGKANSQNLEMIEFDDQTSTFAFRRLRFPEGHAAQSLQTFPKNLAGCDGCHGDPLRPNWEPFGFWPGAYGEKGGDVAAGSDEAASLQDYQAKAGTLPRYQRLPPLQTSFLRDLTKSLYRLNARRIAAQLMATPGYARVKYLVAGVLDRCDAQDPQALPALLPDGRFPDGVATTLADYQTKAQAQGWPLYDREGTSHFLAYLDQSLALGLGVDLANWAPAFDLTQVSSEGDTTAFNSGAGAIALVLQAGLVELDPDLAFLKDADGGACKALHDAAGQSNHS